MKVYITYSTKLDLIPELDLIEKLCKFEKIEVFRCYPEMKTKNGENYFKKYHKDNTPAIIIYGTSIVLYGFWEFAAYLFKYKLESKQTKCPYKLAFIRDIEIECENCEYFILGILDDDGNFKDFYYNSNIEYDTFQQWIPKEFSEAAESLYEFSNNRNPHTTALDVLKKHGYIETQI